MSSEQISLWGMELYTHLWLYLLIGSELLALEDHPRPHFIGREELQINCVSHKIDPN